MFDPQVTENKKVTSKLKLRHITMISIGGVIGAGLFVGSGAVINATGPGAIISYLIAGIVVILTMRMLGEMAVVNPISGSFSTYAQTFIGPWAGYTIGWLYWFYSVMVVAIEAIAGGAIVHGWLPSIPVWVLSLVLTVLLTLTNVVSVRSFGEFEYWFSMTKVIAISLFLCLGVAIIFGIVPGVESPGTHNLFELGGFMPNGISSVFVGMITVVFSLFGTEIAAIAAGEAENPKEAVVKAINSVVWRILLFYIGSITILVILFPWNSTELLKSPFVTMLDLLDIPAAAQIMNIVVLLSVLSCLNSTLYTSSRMLFSLSEKGSAPKIFMHINKGGVPVPALLAGTAFSYVCALFKFISPDKLFLFLINASGAIALLVYLSIAFSHIISRRQMEKNNPEQLVLRMWLFPYLTYVTIGMILVILFSMLFIESLRSQFYLTGGATAFILCCYFLFGRKNQRVIEQK